MQDKSNPIVQLESKYLVAFLLSFAWLLVGPVLFIIPLMMQSQIENGQIIMDGSGTFVLSNVANLIALAIIVGIFYPILLNDLKKWKKDWWKNILYILVAFFLILGFNQLFGYLYKVFKIEGTSDNQQIIVDAMTGSKAIYVILYSVLLAPVFEEIVFRKFLYGFLRIRFKLPAWLCVLLTSIVFALIHVVSDFESLKFFFEYFALALVITTVYAISKENVFASIGAHFLNNLFGVIELL